MNEMDYSDEQILELISRRLAGVEPMVPVPAARDSSLERGVGGGGGSRLSGRTHVRPALGFGGVAAAMLVVVCLAVAAGPLANRGTQGGSVQPTMAPNTMKVIYKVSPTDGSLPTEAQLEDVATVVRARADRYVHGTPATVSVAAPDLIIVVASSMGMIEGDPLALTYYYSPDVLRLLIADAGHVQLVPLPPSRFGTAGVAGPETEPAHGAQIDASLPVEMDNAQFAGGTPTLVMTDQFDGAFDSYNFVVKDSSAGKWQTWVAAHPGERVAVVLDGVVMTVFGVPSQSDGKSVSFGGLRLEDAVRIDSAVHTASLPLPLVMVSWAATQQPEYTGDPGTAVTARPIGTLPPIVAPSAQPPAGVQTSGVTVGNPSAPNTIDIWIDYRCAQCRIAHDEVVSKLMSDYVQTGRAKIVYHDFLVIDMNRGDHESRDAANAARCAADQGKLATYQDWLFANQADEVGGAFSIDRLLEIGRLAGLDMATFGPCVQNGAHNAAVESDSAAAKANAVSGAPAYFVNGREVGNGSPATVLAGIDAGLTAGSPAP